MKVLICLLSGQHIPNLLSVHHFKPDHLVLIQSSGMKKQDAADNFKRALKLGGLDYDERCDVEPLDTEDDLEVVREILDRAYENHRTGFWIANITGGTKLMSIATYEFFKAIAKDVIYTNVSRPSEMIHLLSGKTANCEHKLTIKEFLAGYGFEIRKKEKKIRETEVRANLWAQCARTIARYMTSDDLLVLFDDDRKTARSQGWNVTEGELCVPNAEVRASLRDAFSKLCDGENQSLIGRIDKYEADFLTGGWLEVFVWTLLNEHKESLGIWDVRLGLQIGRVGVPTNNECDVCFMRNSGLSVIECKSGSQEHDTGGDVLYKLEAVVRQFRALQVNSHLVTTGTNVLDREGGLKSSINNRAAIYKCGLLLGADVCELAADDVTVDTIEQKLFRKNSQCD